MGILPESFNYKFPKVKTAKNCNNFLPKLNNTIGEKDINSNFDKIMYENISTHSDKNITNQQSNTKKFKKNK